MNTSGPQTTAAHPSSAESNCLPLPCAFGAAEASDSIGGGEQKKNSNTYVSTESGEVQDRCTEPGEVGRLLRREGLYSSHLTTWRKAAHSGSLKALSKKRGRKPERNPLEEKVRKLERRNARLEEELRKAHLIIDVQGKVAGLLGLSLEDGTNSWRRPRSWPST